MNSDSPTTAAADTLPCYLFVIIPARYFRRAAQNARVKAFVGGVTAAASGAIAGAVSLVLKGLQ